MTRKYSLEDKWLRLAVRHLRICRSLANKFPDGTTFHAYHAFECAVSAFIAAHGRDVPPLDKKRASGGTPHPKSDHKRRISIFRKLTQPTDHSNSLFGRMAPYMTSELRNDSLYHDGTTNRFPYETHRFLGVSTWVSDVEQFIYAVSDDIKAIQASSP